MQHNNSLAVMLFDKKFIANSFRSFLKCPSCRNDFSAFFQQDRGILGGHNRSSRPILLSCGHSMCENCVQQNYKNLVCTECSRPLPVPQHLWNNFKFRKFFEMNFFLVGAIRHLSYYRCDGLCDSSVLLGSESDKRSDRKSKKNNFALKCGECEESSAVGTCSQCNVNYCKKCFEKVHMNSKVLKSHFLNQFDAQQSKVRFHKPRPKQCQRHRQTCDRYCNKCRNTYCRNCIKSDHLTHGNISLLERNENHMDDIFAVLEAVKQSRENTRKAQREIKSVESQFQDYATQTLDDIAHYFWEMHGLLQLEFQKIVQNFSESSSVPQVQMREAYDTLNDNLSTLNNMRSCLESFQHAPSDIDLTYVVQNVTKQLRNIHTEVKITKLDKNPFIFEKVGNFKRDLQNYYSVKYEEPNITISIGPVYENWHQKLMNPMAVTNKEKGFLNHSIAFHEDEQVKSIDMNEHIDDSIGDDTLSTTLDEIVQPRKITPDCAAMLATISYIKSPTYFFLQKCDALKMLNELAQMYEHVEGDEFLPKNITINKIYMGYHEASKKWHRVVVTKMLDENLFKALLVDIGADMEMKRKNIRKLDQRYVDMPYAAVPCSLYNIEPIGSNWSQDAKELMMDISRGKPVRAFILGTFKNEILNVDLLTTYGEEPVSIREAFLYMGLARETPGTSKTLLDFQKMHPVAPLSLQLKKINLHIGDTFPVKITHVENPTEFFIVRADHEVRKDQLNSEMNMAYKNPQKRPEFIYHASLKMCCAIKLKGVWFRGSVEEIEGNGHVRVRFVDEGRTEVVKWNHLYRLDLKFRSQKEFGIRCSLFEVEPLQKNNYTWSPEAVQEFKMAISNPNIYLKVDQNIQNIYRVTLNIQKKNLDINIGAALVRKGYAISTGSSTQIHDISKPSKNSVVELHKQEVLETLSVSQQQQQKNVKPLERVPIKVVHVISPGEFYVYLQSLEEGVQTFHAQLQLSQEALENGSDCSIDLGDMTVWSIGDHCLVHTVFRSTLRATPRKGPNNSASSPDVSQHDLEWFRGIIVDVAAANSGAETSNDYGGGGGGGNGGQTSYTVFLRDRGVTINNINSEQLQPISQAWDCVSNSVQRCHLACLRPAGDTNVWSMSATDCLKRNVTIFNPILATRQGNPTPDTQSMPVFLWGMTSEPTDALAPSVSKYSNINRILLNMGLACKTEPIVITDHMNMIMDMCVDSNQISLDEWYKKNNGTAFLDALERMNVINTVKQNEAIAVAAAAAADEQLDRLNLSTDMDMTPTWDEIAPKAWLKPKVISKTIFTAQPTYVNHSAIIFLHEATDNSTLLSMRAQMLKIFKDIPFDDSRLYRVGQPCVVKYHLDGAFYRGIIIAVDNRTNEYEVQFVDYGNEESVKQEELRPYAPLRHLNSFASKYRFEGIRPPNGEKKYSLGTLDVMHKLIVEKLVSVRVQLTEMHKEIPHCRIRIGSEDIAETLIKDGRVLAHRRGARSYKRGSGKLALQLGINFPPESNYDEEINAAAADHFSEDGENANVIEEIEENEPDSDHPDNFFETEINNLSLKDCGLPPKSCSFDLESAQEMEVTASVAAPSNVFKCSDFTVPVENENNGYNFAQLVGVVGADADDDIADETQIQENPSLNLLGENDADVLNLEGSFISNYWQDGDNIIKNDYDEKELALQWSHIKSLQRENPESIGDFEYFRPQDTSTSLSNFAELDLFKWPKLPTNVRSFRCSVNAVVSPTVLFIFPHLKDFQDRDREIKSLIKQIIKTAKPLANFTPNTLCLACYSIDNCWYRSIIRSYDADALEAEVLFVDYWNVETVSIKNLKQCPMELLNYPLRTLKVQLYGIKPSLRLREKDVCQALKNALRQCDELFVQVQKHPDEIGNSSSSMNDLVEIYMFESESSTNTIYYELIQQKYYTSNK